MHKTQRPRVAILISGRGTNMDAILSQRASMSADFVLVVASNPAAPGLAIARDRHGVEALAVEPRAYPNREAYDDGLHEVLAAHGIDIIVLAGFMRILSTPFVQRYPGAIVNIHPSILPLFPGLHAQRQALAQGVRVSGCSVHFVVPGDVDGGPIIAQAVVPVYTDDTEETLSSRIQIEEHRLYPAALRAIFDGRLVFHDGRVDGYTAENAIAFSRAMVEGAS